MFGGGNGSAAVVEGNSTIIAEGLTSIGKDLFGGGNAAANGSENNENSEVTVLITGGTISGDVYGAANTSVVYGNTHVKIGSTSVNDNTLTKKSITILEQYLVEESQIMQDQQITISHLNLLQKMFI